MNKLRICLLLLITSINTFAQDIDHIKFWSDGKLNFNDFQGETMENASHFSDLQYLIGYQYLSTRVSKLDYTRYVTYSFIYKNISWVKEEGKNPIELRYNQTIFNLAELYSRKLEKELNNPLNKGYASDIFLKIHSKLVKLVNQMKNETHYGAKEDVVREWFKKSVKDLENNTRIILPEYSEEGLGYGFDLGLGYGILNGDIKDYLKNHIDFLNYGFTGNYKRTYFDLRLIIGWHKAKQDFLHTDYSLDYDKGNIFSNLSLTAGYALIKTPKLIIYPYAGGGILNMGRYFDNLTMRGPIKFQPEAGLNITYKIKEAALTINNRMDFVLKTRINYLPVNYLEQLKGSSLNLSIGFGIYFNNIKIDN